MKTTHFVSFCPKARKPFMLVKSSTSIRGILKCPYCGGRHQIKGQASPNPNNPIRKTPGGWWWGGRGPFGTKGQAVSVARAAYASGYKGKNPGKGLRMPRGLADGLVKSEREAEINAFLKKMWEAPPIERNQMLKALIMKARTVEDVDFIRKVVKRGGLLLELGEVQKDIAGERQRKAIGR